MDTSRVLRDRIKERFPDAGLARVAEDLIHVAEKADAEAPAIARPFLPLRIGVAVLVVAILLLLGWIAWHMRTLKISAQVDRFTELFQGLDSALNMLLVLGGAILFLFTVEVRTRPRVEPPGKPFSAMRANAGKRGQMRADGLFSHLADTPTPRFAVTIPSSPLNRTKPTKPDFFAFSPAKPHFLNRTVNRTKTG